MLQEDKSGWCRLIRNNNTFLHYGNGTKEFNVGIALQGIWDLFFDSETNTHFLLSRVMEAGLAAVYELKGNEIINSYILTPNKVSKVIIGSRYDSLFEIPTKTLVKTLIREMRDPALI